MIQQLIKIVPTLLRNDLQCPPTQANEAGLVELDPILWKSVAGGMTDRGDTYLIAMTDRGDTY
jgi:hypothetical protein